MTFCDLRAGFRSEIMLARGCTITQFEQSCYSALRADVPADVERVLLVDDVSTRGSTVAPAIRVLREQQSRPAIVVATAGQMIVKEVVVDDSGFKTQTV